MCVVKSKLICVRLPASRCRYYEELLRLHDSVVNVPAGQLATIHVGSGDLSRGGYLNSTRYVAYR